MKKLTFLFQTIVILTSCLCINQAFGQENYIQGTVIKLNGDSIHGLIDYRNWANNPNVISFKETANSLIVRYSPGTISGFRVNNEWYESAVVDAEISPDKTEDLDFRQKTITRTDTTFLQAMFIGSKSLYSYSDNMGKENFYIRNDKDFVLLVYKKYFKESNRIKTVAENKTFIGQLLLYLQDCPELKPKINSAVYKKSCFENLFKVYYSCSKSTPGYQYVKEKPIYDWGVVAGMSMAKVKFANGAGGFDYLTNTDFPASYNISAGLSLNFIFARFQRKWSIYNELLYSSYEVNGDYTEYFNADRYKIYDVTIGYSYLKINNMIRYTYPMNKNLHIFVDAGISNGFVIAETNNIKLTEVFYSDPEVTNQAAMGSTRRYEQAILAGLGVKYSKYSFEIRGESGNGMSAYSALNSSAKRLYFLLGYRF